MIIIKSHQKIISEPVRDSRTEKYLNKLQIVDKFQQGPNNETAILGTIIACLKRK